MTAASTMRSVQDALQDAAHWRADQASRQKAEQIEVDQQLAELRLSLANLQEKLAALEQFRASFDARGDELRKGEVQRAHDGIFEVLDAQRGALEGRSAELVAAEARRAAMLETVLAESDLASKLVEYKQFKQSVEPALAQMPESYRKVVLGHHEQVAAALRQRVAELTGDPVHAEGPPLTLDVVYAVDAPDGVPELLVVVTPVAAKALESWQDRPEDLQTRLAARVVQAIYEACFALGLEGVQVQSGGHRDLLAIEADVAGAPAGLAEELGRRLEAAFRGALELVAAKVTLTARGVHADQVLGLVDEEDDDAE